jgi:hypothetical protein
MGGGGGMGTGRIRGGGGRGEEEEEGGAHLQTPSGTRRGHGDPAIFLFSFFFLRVGGSYSLACRCWCCGVDEGGRGA